MVLVALGLYAIGQIASVRDATDNIVARDLKVVVSPAFGDMEVIGMNFLSKLASWRVEGRTLVLVPHNPQAVEPQASSSMSQ